MAEFLESSREGIFSFADIEQAAVRLKGKAKRTPVLTSQQFNLRAGCEVFFKAENFQRTGSFKFRGAFNKISAELDRNKFTTVVAYSSGNHAQAVALTAKELNLRSIIVMPQDAPAPKIEATRSYGAEIVFYDRYTEDRASIAARIVAESDAVLVPPFDDLLIMAGQGTAALELMEETPDLDCLLTPLSGGGLLAGCASAAKNKNARMEIYGVEPEEGNDTQLSFNKGERVSIPVPKTIADGLQVNTPGKLTFPINRKLVSGILLVSDNEILETMKFMLQRMKIVIEPSGAAAAAALFFKKHDFSRRRIGVILSGGNADLNLLKKLL